MSRRDIPNEWPGGITPRSGRATRAEQARILDAQAMMLGCTWKTTIHVPVCSWARAAVTDSEYGSGNHGQETFAVPPWTQFIAWNALADGDGSIYLRRYYIDGAVHLDGYTILRTQSTDPVLAYTGVADSATPSNLEAGYIELSGTLDGEWHTITVDWYLDGAELYELQFTPMAPQTHGAAVG